MASKAPNWNPVAAIREDKYFQRPRMWVILSVPLALCLLAVTYLIPDYFPFHLLGPLGALSVFVARYMPTVLKVVFYTALFAHLIEGWLAVKVCRQKGIHPETTRWWAAQTCLYGYFSLYHLVQYEPKLKKT